MNKTTTALAVVGAICLATTSRAQPITIDEALERASRRPSVQVLALDGDTARAHARGAALPLHNPELTGGAGPQFGAGASALQLELGLVQIVELGGKRAARVRVADAEVRLADVSRKSEVLRARVEAWLAFQQALIARDRLATRVEIERLAKALAGAMQQTAQAGGTTRLRVNVVAADAGRARQARIVAEAEQAGALARLGAAIGAPPAERLEPVGGVVEPPRVGDIDVIIERALRSHPAVVAADREIVADRARVGDAYARGVPDLTLGLGYAYAPDPDGAHAIVASVAIPLAVRNRNQGDRAAARIGLRRAGIERARVRAEIERRVRLAYDNYRRARDAVSGFGDEISEKLGENLAAAQDAFANGGLDFVELTTIQRELIAARIAFLDARAVLADAWAELALAAALEVKP